MTKHLVAAAAAVALCFVAGAEKAEARDIHIRAGGVHVDIGNPHSNGYSGRRVVAHSGHGRIYGRTIGYRGFAPSAFQQSRRHNTSHYDWHGPSRHRHGNHFDYAPRVYDYHRSGYWHRH